MNDAFKDRERALEAEFFYRVDKQLLANLKEKLANDAQREQLAAATGFGDDSLLNELLAVGVSSEAIAAISLVPLVLVSWADGKVDAEERVPILQAALDQGIFEESPAWKLLVHWLENKPSPQLATAWRHYLQAAKQKMSEEARKSLRSEVIRRGRAVANATRGPHLLTAMSTEEKHVIAEIEQSLND